MKISIITVCFNSEKSIEHTLQSILNQTIFTKASEVKLEYLIIDGKSKDRTVEIAENYRARMEEKGIEYRVNSEPDGGIYDAMNKGIRMATGEVIGILNSDDWYEEKTLEIVADTFANEKPELMYADIRMHKADGTTFIKHARSRRFQTSRDWNHPTTFVLASLYKAYPFRNLGIHDDYGFFLQMKKQGRKIVLVKEVLANFKMGGASNRKDLKAACKRIRDRYQYCYRINGYSRLYLVECVAIEAAKMLLG